MKTGCSAWLYYKYNAIYTVKKIIDMFHNVFNFVSVCFCIFVTISCGSRKKYITDNQTDSLVSSKNIFVKNISIPESRADLAIPISSLVQLPQGASYVKKERQATAHVRYVSDTLFITSTCDSLQQLLFSYEQTINRLSRSQHQQHTERHSLPRLFYLSVIAILILLAFAGMKYT